MQVCSMLLGHAYGEGRTFEASLGTSYERVYCSGGIVRVQCLIFDCIFPYDILVFAMSGNNFVGDGKDFSQCFMVIHQHVARRRAEE